MKLSEKTIELTMAAQSSRGQKNAVWFGLTQRQEAKWGYDAATTMGGRIAFFQFKASNKVVASGRQFRLEHRQLTHLQTLSKVMPGAVYYAVPNIGNTYDLEAAGWDLLREMWLLDVNHLPVPFPPPTKRSGGLRKDGKHYAVLKAPQIIIHSEPVKAIATPLAEIIEVQDLGIHINDLPLWIDVEPLFEEAFRKTALGVFFPF